MDNESSQPELHSEPVQKDVAPSGTTQDVAPPARIRVAAPRQCPNCGAAVRAGASICTECGEHVEFKPKKIHCRRCGGSASSALMVCPHCGRDLHPAAPRLITWGLPVALVLLFAIVITSRGGFSSPWVWAQERVAQGFSLVSTLGDQVQPGITVVMTPIVPSEQSGQAVDSSSPSVIEIADVPQPAEGESLADGTAAADEATGNQENGVDASTVSVEQPTELPTESPTEAPTEAPTQTATPLPTATPEEDEPEPTATAEEESAPLILLPTPTPVQESVSRPKPAALGGGAATTPTVAPTHAPANTPTRAPTATPAPPTPSPAPQAQYRLEAPLLRSPENGASVSCGSAEALAWQLVPFIRADDEYIVHLGYLSGVSGSGVEQITWIIRQPKPSTESAWTPNGDDLCGLAPQDLGREWRWFVEVTDFENSERFPVSPPSEIWRFRWN